MAAGMETTLDRTFRVYASEDTHFFLSWIAEGTDGTMYTVPSEPGGWHRRRVYSGSKDGLKPVTPEKAQAIARFVGGDRVEANSVAISSEIPATEVYSYTSYTDAN
jgi:hypothetical protein